MSLMRLLAATRSIANIRDGRSPYKMDPDNLLPKFGPKGPETKAPTPEPAPHPTPGHAGSEQGIASGPPAPTPSKQTMNTVEVEANIETGVPAAAYPQGRWTFLKRAFAPKPAARAAAVPVQGELALDLVRVVRNALNDADLEVVRARPKRAAPARPKREAAPETRYLWSRITARLFGAGGTLR